MNKRKAIWTAVFLAVVVVLCVAGTKVSRITQTTTIQGDSLFLVVTGSQSAGTLQSRSIEASNLLSQLTNFPGWPAGGSATNAITTLKTNGTSVSAAATTLNLIAGTNVVLNATNTAGVVDVRINAAGDLNALTNVDAGAVVFLDTGGNDTAARRGRIDKPALTATNAQALAQSGDQIFVRPGLYNLGTNRLALRSNVKWYFEPGARFAMLDAANPDGIAMFHDHGGAATNCGIYGYGQFFQTNTYGPVLHMTNLASSVTFDAQDCYMLQVGQDAAIKRVGGDLILNIKGTLKAVYDTYLDEPLFSIASNKVVAYAQNIEAYNSIIETAKPFRNQGDFYFKFGHATRLAGSGTIGGGEGGIEGTDNCIVEGGAVFLDGDGSKIVGNGSGGEPFIFRNAVVTVVSTNRTPAVGYMSSGEGGSRLHLQNVFLNAQIPVDPVMIHTNGGFTIEDSTILAGASSTNAIRATNAQNVKLLGSVRYNKPLSANVTIVEHSSTMTNRLHRTHITGTLQTDSVIASADVTATAGLYGATGDVTADFNVGGVLVSGFVFPANSTANRALATDAAGYATNSAATMTELGYLSGVGGAIQTQLNSATNRIETKQAGAAALSNIVASGFALPYITIATNGGANNSVTQLVVRTATGMVVSNDASGIASIHVSSTGGAGDVTAAASFSTDNRVIRSDGTGKGVQAGANATLDDNGTITAPAVTTTNLTVGENGTLALGGGADISMDNGFANLNEVTASTWLKSPTRTITPMLQVDAISNALATLPDNLHLNGSVGRYHYTASTNASLVLTNLQLNTPVEVEIHPASLTGAGWAITFNCPAAAWPNGAAQVIPTNAGPTIVRFTKTSATRTNAEIVSIGELAIEAGSNVTFTTNFVTRTVTVATGGSANIQSPSGAFSFANSAHATVVHENWHGFTLNGQNDWTEDNNASSNNTRPGSAAPDANHVGIVSQNLTTNAASRCWLVNSYDGIYLGGGAVYWEAKIKFHAISSAVATGTNVWKFGLMDTRIDAESANSVYFRYDNALSDNWVVWSRSNGGASQQWTNGAPVTTSWHVLGMKIAADASSCIFYTNGVAMHTNTTVPTGVSQAVGPTMGGHHAVALFGTVIQTNLIDYIWWAHVPTTTP
jgi:hypothetical protein